SVGFLHQEPRLDQTKSVLGNVEEGVAEIKALLARYDDVNAKLGEDLSPEEMDKVLEEQSRIQDRIDASNAWDLDSQLEHAMDALRLPPPVNGNRTLSGGAGPRCGDGSGRRRPPACRGSSAGACRCAACCGSRPICCCSPSRRTISRPNRS